jgi:hypothetical protein
MNEKLILKNHWLKCFDKTQNFLKVLSHIKRKTSLLYNIFSGKFRN